MPHLAPFSWLFIPLIFWFMLLIYNSTTWWMSPPQMKPFLSPNLKTKMNYWKW